MTSNKRSYTTCGYLGLLAALILLPLLMPSNYYLFLAIMVGIYFIMIVGLNLIIGFTGLLSLAHGSFFAIGAYACAILQLRGLLTFWPSLLAAAVVTALLAIAVGVPMLRTKGPYFAIGTLCLTILVALVLTNWVSLTGGTSLGGIPGPAPIRIFEWQIDFLSNTTYYYLVLIFAVLSAVGIYRLIHSRVGRAFMAIRDQEELAEAVGIGAMKFKLLAFTTGAVLAGLAGALYAGYMGALDPDIAGALSSFNMLVMSIVGGASTLSGALIGTMVLWLVPEVLHFSHHYKPLIFGVMLLLIIIYMPNGIMGFIRQLHPKLSQWIR
jgi:branched-chain amino acid transport system permease protein